MKKTCIMAIILVFGLSTAAFSAKMGGQFGIGYATDIGCASLRLFFADFGIDIVAGFTFEAQNEDMGDQTFLLDLRCGAFFIYALELVERANLNVFAGAIAEFSGSHTEEMVVLNFYARGGLSPEIFILDNVSVEASFGVILSYANASGLAERYRLRLEMFGSEISIVSGLTFHWYFGKGKAK